ncbi:hypothetical protein Gotri_027729, partial [Gossypium trilobum]|nr:hypothetical protein [Gossypium trilobum]
GVSTSSGQCHDIEGNILISSSRVWSGCCGIQAWCCDIRGVPLIPWPELLSYTLNQHIF